MSLLGAAIALIIVGGGIYYNFIYIYKEDKYDNLKQIIFFVAPVALSFYFLEKFIALYLFTATFLWFGYSALLISKKSSLINSISFKNNYLGIFLMLSFLFSLIYLMLFLEFPGMNKFFVLFLVLFSIEVRRIWKVVMATLLFLFLIIGLNH